MFKRYKVIHFVGIGGIGMSGIAEVLNNLGYEVTGSDLKESDTVARLRSLGIKVMIGHRPENIGNAHVVVISSAVDSGNAEVSAAKERLIPVIPRAEMLAELMRLKYGIVVAGAHGKTTTTSLIAAVTARAGLDPTVVIGGKLKGLGSNAKLGQGQYMVAEADESDGSFLKLTPTIAVVTNIDREHLEYFKSLGAIKDAFVSFINKIPFYGLSVLCYDNEHVRELIPLVRGRYMTYGLTGGSKLSARNIKPLSSGGIGSGFDVFYEGSYMGYFEVPLPGLHSVSNSLAAIGVAIELEIDMAVVREALQCFEGIQRRFEFKGEAKGIRVFDDYGHHPTEIKATLKAAKSVLRREGQRLTVLFQPHRYTRTRDLFDDFLSAFDDADRVILMDIYPAGERPINGISSSNLYKKMKETGQVDVVYKSDRDEIITGLSDELKQGDVLFTIGAGDVWKMGEEVLRRLSIDNRRQRHG